LRVPGHRAGKGKVNVSIQGRNLELEAVTAGEELSTGAACRIVKKISPGIFEVAALD
jgi:hypothetical protein